MDEFGVLTERYGLKPQGKSAPMAATKRPTNNNNVVTSNFGSTTGTSSRSSSWNSSSGNASLFHESSSGSSMFDGDIFGGLPNHSSSTGMNSSFDFESVFPNSSAKTSSFNGYAYNADVLTGASVNNDNIFGSYSSSTKQSSVVDDLLGDFGGFGLKSKSLGHNGSGNFAKNSAGGGYDDLIPGFGRSNSSSDWVKTETNSASGHTSSDLFGDPLEEFGISQGTKAGGASSTYTKLKPPPKPTQVLKADKVKSSGVSSIDELEEFAMGRVRNSANKNSISGPAREVSERQSAKSSRHKEPEDNVVKTQQNGAHDLESFFYGGSRSSSVPKSRSASMDPIFDAMMFNKKGPEAPTWTSFGASSGVKKASSSPDLVDDLSAIFAGGTLNGEFQKVEGESEERERARMGRHQRTQDRVAKAVADMNQRDLRTQHEQEERERIAEILNVEIKRWAAGKEGNLRALLSSLQNVLWSGSGWEPVPLTDLITSVSVKKVYRRATLCVHPDKVQQKGATLEQKYTAEKVFDILKEAWKKFNKEELS